MLKNDVDRSPKGFDLVLNVDAPFNRNVDFPPVQGTLQGDVRVERIASDTVPGYLNQIGGWIPGYQLQINTKTGKARIVDRLKQEEHADLEVKCRRLCATTDDIRFQRLGEQWKRDDGVVDEGEYTIGTGPTDNIQTWLWHIATRVKKKRLHVVTGKLPSFDEIRRMGDIFLGDNYGVTAKEGQKPFNVLHQEDAVPAGAV